MPANNPKVELSKDFEDQLLRRIEMSRISKNLFEAIFTGLFSVMKLFINILVIIFGHKKEHRNERMD